MRTTVDQERSLQQQLAAAIYVSAPDTGVIDDLVNQLVETQRRMLESDVAVQQRVAALLTDAQREQLLRLLKQGPPRRGPPQQD